MSSVNNDYAYHKIAQKSHGKPDKHRAARFYAVRLGMSTENEPPETSDADKVTLLETLRAEHRHLDTDIRALYDLGITDMLKIARMKKLKLRIKDRIAALEDEITPDIIA